MLILATYSDSSKGQISIIICKKYFNAPSIKFNILNDFEAVFLVKSQRMACLGEISAFN